MTEMESPDRDADQFGARIRERRRASGLTQRQLADAAGVSVGMLRDLEQGVTARPRRAAVLRLAAVLNLGTAQPDAAAAAQHARGDSDQGQSGLYLQVLGPIGGWHDGHPLALGSASQRAVLALLAVNANTTVNRESIVDALWGEQPPPSAITMVQSHVCRLRRVLCPGHRARAQDGRLITTSTGYRLNAASSELDLVLFGELVSQARAARDAGQLAAAVTGYQRALRLWRGEALADVVILRRHPAVAGLTRQREAAITEFAETADRLGSHDLVLGQLEELTERSPFNERAHAQLMIALAGTGQQARALELFRQTRQRLAAELGLPPGRELTHAQQRVLKQQVVIELPRERSTRPGDLVRDPAQAPAPAAAGTRNRPAADQTWTVIPRQLPAATRHFAGRADELSQLDRLLADLTGPEHTVPVCAIAGMAGIGKTTLSVQWAQRVAEHFPDGQLYVNLRGFGPAGSPAEPAEALLGFLEAFQVPASAIPPSLDGRAALYRSLLADLRVLVLLDNARDAEQVRPLLPGGSGCLALVTSRDPLTSLVAVEGAQPLALDVLCAGDASELVAGRLGARTAATEAAAVGDLIELCGRLPLALSIAAARVAAGRGVTLAILVRQLRAERGRLDALEIPGSTGPGASVRAVFEWSYRSLSDAGARMFRLLGVHPGPEISAQAATSLAALPPHQASNVLAELTAAHLLSEHLPGRFAFHDLVRSYAAEQARSGEEAASQRAAMRRVLDYYLHSALAASVLLSPTDKPTSPAPCEAGAVPELFEGRDQALSWFLAEQPVLVAAVLAAAEWALDVRAWQLAAALGDTLGRRGNWHDRVVTQQSALAAAMRLGDQAAVARAHRSLGDAYIGLGRNVLAATHLRQALNLCQAGGDQVGEGACMFSLARVAEQQGRYDEAVGQAERALSLHRATGNELGQAWALNAIGWFHANLGQPDLALARCRAALRIHTQLGNQMGQAVTLDSLAYAHHLLGEYARAATLYNEALACFRQVGDLYFQSESLARLGDAYEAAGEAAMACQTWQQALVILSDLHHPDAGRIRAKLNKAAGLHPAPA
jgi:DNA-binding SARP family transcriptional activator/DNA-binding XRE family transcriptional regulator